MEIIFGIVGLIVSIIVIAAITKTASNTSAMVEYQRKSFRVLKAMAYKQGVIDGKGNFIGLYVDAEGNISTEPPNPGKKKADEKKESDDKLKNAIL